MGVSMIHFERILGTRVVALPDAVDAIGAPAEGVALRFAPDEVLLTAKLSEGAHAALISKDPHAIAIDEGAFSGAWIDEDRALKLLARLAEWPMPSERPVFAQGAVAGLPTKLWFEDGRVFFVVQTPYAHELEERLSH